MQKLKQKIMGINKVFAIALLASVLAIPFALRVYAQDTPPAEEQQTQTEQEQPAEEPQQEPTTVTQTPADPQDTNEGDETPVADPQEQTPTPQETSITEAIAIAQAEHPGVEVVVAKVKAKLLDDEKVYKIVFADGWRLYIRASDGAIVRIKDQTDKKHDCGERGAQAVEAWQNKFRKQWGHSPVRHHYNKQQNNWGPKSKPTWPNPKQPQPTQPTTPDTQTEPQQPAETETPAEQ